MTRGVIVVGAMLLGVTVGGCSPDDGTSTESSTSSSTDGSTSSPSTNTSPTSTTTATTTTADTTAGDTVADDTTAGIADLNLFDCDLFAQDCPEGYKCTPYASSGSTWDALRCVPVVDDPDLPGEPCTARDDAVDGFDTCDATSMCFDLDPETSEGTCHAFCTGDEAEPTCTAPEEFCAISAASPLALCFQACDPLDPAACPEGEVCIPDDNMFLCISDQSGDMGAAGDPCQFLNVCDPAHACIPPDQVPGCPDDLGCCSAFCSLGDPKPPCLPGQTCVPWYEPGSAPEGFEDLGMCAVME